MTREIAISDQKLIARGARLPDGLRLQIKRRADMWSERLADWMLNATEEEDFNRRLGRRSEITPATTRYEQRMRAVNVALMSDLDDASAIDLATAIERAPAFLWTNEIRLQTRDVVLPRHIVGSGMIPHPDMWWTWESDMDVGGASGIGIFVREVAAGITYYSLVETGHEDGLPLGLRVRRHRIEYGSRYPDAFEGDVRASDNAGLLRMLAFLNSPFVAVERHAPRPQNRAVRRRLSLVQKPSPLVHTVRLRAALASAAAPSGGHESREWRARWMVRGHIRAQWYPSQNAHRLIWIAPHVKGPEDKPISGPIYVVNR